MALMRLRVGSIASGGVPRGDLSLKWLEVFHLLSKQLGSIWAVHSKNSLGSRP